MVLVLLVHPPHAATTRPPPSHTSPVEKLGPPQDGLVNVEARRMGQGPPFS